MKIAAQLLKEFWLPLLLGILWTAYNVTAMPISDWTLRNAINIFGPSFFFISWLIAQWYRVKKQQSVEEGLTDIKEDIRAMKSPLLPCNLFYTLKYIGSDRKLNKLFKDRDGWMKYAGDDVLLRPVGLTKLNSAYNSINFEVKESRCSIGNDEIKALTDGEKEIFLLIPTETNIEFFLNRKKLKESSADLTLCTDGAIGNNTFVIGAELFDKTIFQDTGCRRLRVISSIDRSWSTSDLKGMFVRVTLNFFFLKPINGISKEEWPTLHNLQLVIGKDCTHLLSFSEEQLSKQVVQFHPNPLIRGEAENIQIIFNCEIDKNVYKNNLYVTESRHELNG